MNTRSFRTALASNIYDCLFSGKEHLEDVNTIKWDAVGGSES